jgi:hypothetical protein
MRSTWFREIGIVALLGGLCLVGYVDLLKQEIKRAIYTFVGYCF